MNIFLGLHAPDKTMFYTSLMSLARCAFAYELIYTLSLCLEPCGTTTMALGLLAASVAQGTVHYEMNDFCLLIQAIIVGCWLRLLLTWITHAQCQVILHSVFLDSVARHIIRGYEAKFA